ncbi:hypothetical protein BEQ56_12600 [Anaerolineaceae bacterium oral taxon 439]|nr:hypothetical protein BEQ56_12600 [Anaerolineaceae bacterium oral taxon 439]
MKQAADFFTNPAIIAAFFSWFVAQALKPVVNFCIERRWNWFLVFQSGGMPSSHSALVTSVAATIGIWQGFNSPTFGVAVALVLIVTYDASHVRWQAGLQAQKINQLIRDFFTGQQIDDELLKEVLGHTPRQVYAGALLGIVIAILVCRSFGL